MSTCKQCEFWIKATSNNAPGLPPDTDAGFCYGMPPQVVLIPVRANSIQMAGQQQTGLMPQPVRALILSTEPTCSLFRQCIETPADMPN